MSEPKELGQQLEVMIGPLFCAVLKTGGLVGEPEGGAIAAVVLIALLAAE